MRFTRPTVAILLLAYFPACTYYQAVADPSSELVASPMQLNKA